MRMRRWSGALAVVALLLSGALVVVSALADLRSPTATAELGAALADDPAVQSALVEAAVEAVIESTAAGNAAVAPLVPFLRPVLTSAIRTTIASPAGRAAVATTLTDALRQLTYAGPIVLDLRAAMLAAALEMPSPLDALARAAVQQGDVGLIVLGGDGTSDPDALRRSAGRSADTGSGQVGGLPGRAAVAIVAVLLALTVLALLAAPGAGRRRATATTGAVLLVVGGASAVLLRSAPDAIVTRLTTRPELTGAAGSAFGDLLPPLVTGLADLLGTTATIGVTMAASGAILIGAATMMRTAGSPSAGTPTAEG